MRHTAAQTTGATTATVPAGEKTAKLTKEKKIIIEPQVFAFAACIKRIKGVFRFVAKPPQKG